MAYENPEKEREWLDHFQKVYGVILTEREKAIYHFGFEDGERHQIRRITAGSGSAKFRRGFEQGDPIQRLDDTPFQQGDPIEKL